MEKITRCEWAASTPFFYEYHDKEWGKPVYDDRLLFEMLILEGAQAGLSWLTVLKKRESYKVLFDNFDAKKISSYTDKKLEEILQNPSIIRNKLKIFSVRKNAQGFLKVIEEFGSFSRYIWSFVDEKPIINNWKSGKEHPANTKESDKMSKDLKKRGFTFVGTTICYAYMQSIGMVNDHIVDCQYR